MEDDFESEDYGSENSNDEKQGAKDGQKESGGKPLERGKTQNFARGKTARFKRRKRNQMAAQAEWAKMPTTWDQVDLESDKKFFNLVEGEAEENRLN